MLGLGLGVMLGVGLELGRGDLDRAHRVNDEAAHVRGHIVLVVELSVRMKRG